MMAAMNGPSNAIMSHVAASGDQKMKIDLADRRRARLLNGVFRDRIIPNDLGASGPPRRSATVTLASLRVSVCITVTYVSYVVRTRLGV